MNQTPLFTRAEIEAVLRGHRDAVHTRLVALMVIKGAVEFYAAMRDHEIPRSTLFNAKCQVESNLYGTADWQRKANEISGASDI
jgi:tellurite resistance-related uncharacterized protein